MKFDVDDENYIYMEIGKNIKKYRKLKGLTQEEFAEKLNYSRSFISSIEADNILQTFSLGTLWTMSRELDVDFEKLCSPNIDTNKEFITFKCDSCGKTIDYPYDLINTFVVSAKASGQNKDIEFKCNQKNCNGKVHIINKNDIY